MSASPDNRSSDILFLKYDLIRWKPENERSDSAELTGRGQPIISKPRMLEYIASSAYFTHSIRFPGSCKVGVHCFQKYCHSLTQKEERTVYVSPVAKIAAFLLNYEDCHASPRQMEPRKKFRAQPCCLR